MNADEAKHGLAIRVIWRDEEMIELACTLSYGKFSGESTCYTTLPQLNDFADALNRFSLTAKGQPTFESGLGDGSKSCNLRAYTTDKACHMVVHVRMATEKWTARPQSVARLELEIPVEAWALSQFAEQLRSVATTRAGEALLAVCDVIMK